MVKLQELSNSINLFQLSMIENFKLSSDEINEEFTYKLFMKGYLRDITFREEWLKIKKLMLVYKRINNVETIKKDLTCTNRWDPKHEKNILIRIIA